MLNRRKFLLGGMAAAAGISGTAGYAHFVEPFWVQVERRTLPLRPLPAAWVGKTIVQLSDLHVCYRIPLSYLRDAFHRVQALQPDLVLYTGDFITLESDTFERLDRLGPDFPHGRIGTFGILGNHDYGPGWNSGDCAVAVLRFAGKHGIRILRNEVVNVSGLRLGGTDELWAGRFEPHRVLDQVDPEDPLLLMAHNPDCADLLPWGGHRACMLSGHTHGGQCRPPFLPPPLLPVRNRRYTAGAFDLGPGRSLYINRGLGYLRQVRFNVRPEITVFTCVA